MPGELFDSNNEAYDLYGGTPPHVEGSDTSAEAATSVLPTLGEKAARVLALFHQYPEGLICGEVESITRLTHQSASARVRELVLKGKIHDTGARKVYSATGRRQRVYKLGPNPEAQTPEGRWTAPFTQHQVAALADVQLRASGGLHHGYTCPSHTTLLKIPTKIGWICANRGCKRVQLWAHPAQVTSR